MNIEELKKRAEAGDAEAMCELGCLYYKGNETVQRNYKFAFECCLVAAEQGYAPAQSLIAEMCYFGKKIGKDLKKAMFWAEKAAEQNDIKGIKVLAELYYSGSYADMDKYKWCLEKAYRLGDDASKYNLGIYHLWHDDAEKGKTLLEELAIQSNKDAVYQLALYYLKNKDGDKAEEWLVKFDWACGECFEIGREFFYHEDFDKADAWFERSVVLENTQIGYVINLYDYSSCKDRLLYWVKKVEQFAEAGNSDFQHEIGDYYYNGTGVKKNKNTALRWYIKAYENGLKDAWRKIVQCYFDKKNEEQVFIWTERAVNDGYVDAYVDLGQL